MQLSRLQARVGVVNTMALALSVPHGFTLATRIERQAVCAGAAQPMQVPT